MKFLILNGPNLNLLGVREPDIYGKRTYADLVRFLEDHCRQLGVGCEIRQSNVAILDALKAVSLPAAEVHLSDVDAREPFRAVSYAGLACLITCKGRGFDSYREAIDYLVDYLNAHREGEETC